MNKVSLIFLSKTERELFLDNLKSLFHIWWYPNLPACQKKREVWIVSSPILLSATYYSSPHVSSEDLPCWQKLFLIVYMNFWWQFFTPRCYYRFLIFFLFPGMVYGDICIVWVSLTSTLTAANVSMFRISCSVILLAIIMVIIIIIVIIIIRRRTDNNSKTQGSAPVGLYLLSHGQRLVS